jgi:hypothetical protein
MQQSTRPLVAASAANATTRPQPAAHIGTPNAAGLFYAACSRGYGEEICGCPICQQAARNDE